MRRGLLPVRSEMTTTRMRVPQPPMRDAAARESAPVLDLIALPSVLPAHGRPYTPRRHARPSDAQDHGNRRNPRFRLS